MPEPNTNRVSSDELRGLLAEGLAEREPIIPRRDQIRELPYDQLHWKQFERLLLDLVDSFDEVDGASLYGVEGGAQEGIDIYAPLIAGGYDVIQCKQVQAFGPAKIRAMVDLFLDKHEDGSPYVDEHGKRPAPITDDVGNIYPRWPSQTRKFILAISMPLDTPAKQREVERVRRRLGEEGITFEVWDPRRVNRELRQRPHIVDLHFGRAMVQAFCGAEAAAALGPMSEMEKRTLQAIVSVLDLSERTAVNVDEIRATVFDMRDQGVHLTPRSTQKLVNEVTLRISRTTTEAPILETDTFSTGLEALRTLINAGHGNADAASAKIKELLPHLGQQAKEGQAKFYRLKGSFHYNLEQLDECADAYDTAFEIDPAAEHAVKLKGLAHLLRHEGQPALRYLRRVREATPDEGDVQAMYAEALVQTETWDELEDLERGLTPDQLSLGLTLARWHLRDRNWSRMEGILNILSTGPHSADPHLQLLLGKLQLNQWVHDGRTVNSRVRAIEVRRAAAAQQVEEHFNRAMEGLDRNTALLSLRTEALNARQVLRCLTGRHRESLEDARKALSLDPSLTSVQLNLVIAHLHLNDPSAALQVLDDFGEAILSELPSSRIIFGSAARRSGNPQRALRLLDVSSPELTESQRVDLLNERVTTLLELERLDEARALTEAEKSTSPMAHVTRATVALKEEDHPSAEQHFEAAITAGSGELIHRVDYASYLASRGKPRQAVEWIEALDWSSLPDDWLEDMIVVLYQGHAFSQARVATKERASRGPLQRMAAAVIAGHLDALDGDLAKAIPKFVDAAERWPKEPWPKLHLASAYARQGERRTARALIKQLIHHRQMPWWMFLEASTIASQLGMATEARALAYQAVRQGYAHEETHLNFINVMNDFREGTISQIVRPETAVQVEDVDLPPGSARDSRWIVITDDPEPEISRGEHAPTDPLAITLLGKAKGQVVTLPNGRALRILQVVSKFSNAERVWLVEGYDLFPLSDRRHFFRMGELGILPEGLWDLLRTNNEADEALQQRIGAGVFPATFLSQRRGLPEATLWGWWVNASITNLSFQGSRNELEDAEKAAGSERIILHSSTLALLHRAKLLVRLTEIKTLIVTRATLDDLSAALIRAKKDERNAPITRISYQGGRINITEESVETLRADRTRLEALADIARRQTIKPDLGLTQLLENNDLAEVSVASASVFLAGKRDGIPVLCEDHTLSLFAREGRAYGARVAVASTLALTHVLQKAGLLGEAEATRWMIALASAGQGHIPRLTEDIVGGILRRSDLKRDPAMGTILRTIGRPEADMAETVQDTSLLLKYGLLHFPLPESQEVWMRDVLDTVIGDRPLLSFYRGLRRALDERLHLAPHLHLHAQDILNRWTQGRWEATVAQPLDTQA